MKVIVIYKSHSAQDVYLKKAILDDNNIPNFISDENVNTWFPHLSIAIDGVKLNVPDTFAIQASELLTPRENPIQCPECKSKNVIFNQLNTFLSLFVSLFFFIPFPFYKRAKFECMDCKCKWSPKED